MLTAEADPETISVTGTSTVTANLFYNSDGNNISGSGLVPDGGATVHFSTDFGTVGPTADALSNAEADTTLDRARR